MVLEGTLGVPIFQEQVIQLTIVAAGLNPGEADQLRRAMAAWKKRGGVEPFRQNLFEGMQARGYEVEFAERIYRQILGFGDYGFPESHAASFALLVYALAWLKRHEPEAFACALLNSQPMGFYAPALLVSDVRRHGAEVRPVEVCSSEWESTLEENSERPALRLGLRQVKGMSEAGAGRLVVARQKAPFLGVSDLEHRARLGRKDLAVLATAGALARLAGHRHRARWEAAGAQGAGPVFESSLINRQQVAEGSPLLRTPTEGENVIADYASLGLTLGRHPLALLRDQLAGEHTLTAGEFASWPEGERVRVPGLVINRQRPETASGVMFMTLEDETGFVNLVVWPGVAERDRRAALGGSLLAASGRIQRTEGVAHLIVEHFDDLSNQIRALHVSSRNFRYTC